METQIALLITLALSLGYITYRKYKANRDGFNTRMQALIDTLNEASKGKRHLSLVKGEGSDKETFVNMGDEVVNTTSMIKKLNKDTEKIMQLQLQETSAARSVLGFPGRMISQSKSAYQTSNPSNVAIFNSNICTDTGKIWYGDIDLTMDENRLKTLAAEINKTLYVLREMDARFENETKPKLESAVIAVKADGSVILSNYATRGTKGKLKGKIVVNR